MDKLLPLTLCLYVLSSSMLFGAEINLPLGGVVSIDTNEWQVENTKKIMNKKTIILLHKNHKALKGFLFDGTIKDVGGCDKNHKSSQWKTCSQDITMKKGLSHQISLQRMLGPNAHQTYIFSFNYPKDKEKEFKPVLNKFTKYLGTGK